VSLVVHTARFGSDDPDILSLSRSHNKKVVKDGWPGGHRGIGVYFSPSAGLQNVRYQRCGFHLANEHPEEWQLYADAYVREMRDSYRKHREAWDTLLSWQRVVLVCNSETPERSVRRVLASDVLRALGATYLGELK
jgi:hypothetical protein